MNIRFLKLWRTHKGEFHRGRWKAQRIHVGSRTRTVIRECFTSIAPPHRKRLAVNAAGRPMKPARLALYLGALAGHRANQNLCARYRF